MQKPVRPGVNDIKFIQQGKRVFFEALNPNFGYFYTVNKTICKTNTGLQNIELIDTDEFGKVLLLDNITQLGLRNEYCYHEPMVHAAVCCHPDPKTVLVIGGGDGGILGELVKYKSIKQIDLAELDEKVIRFARKHLKPVHHGSFDDVRVRLNIVDGRKYTDDHPGKFDLVIMDMTDPVGPSRLLYTNDFFRIVLKALKNQNGIFVMHSESPVARPKTFSCINKTLRSVFSNVNQMYTYIQMYGTLWSFALSSPKINTSSVSADFINSRLKKQGITGLKFYNGATHIAMHTPYPFLTSLLKRRAYCITDKRYNFPDDLNISYP